MSEEKSLPKNNFGANLTALRKAAGLKRKELAEKMEMHETTFAGYEIGKFEPRFELLIKLSRFFNVSIDELICDETSQIIRTREKLIELDLNLSKIEEMARDIYKLAWHTLEFQRRD